MKNTVENILKTADILINGSRPWDIRVHNDELYARVLSGGSLALGESYMDGWWDAEKLDQFFDKLLRAAIDQKVINYRTAAFHYLRAKLCNLQNIKRAFHIGEHHYDLGNDLYEIMLDERMTYTCGYWRNADNLNQAQENKLDLICRKLNLRPGMKMLDIGCGWGSLVKFAAEKYGVSATGITVSREQAALAAKKCAGLDVEIKLLDYRSMKGQFDAVVSVGMFEHVGAKNYRTFMQVAKANLKPNGLHLLHTIGGNKSVYATDPWISKYIFPNSMLPSAKQITTAAEGLFVLEDWHSFGQDYDKTLMAWFDNFHTGWDKIKQKYGDRFYRLWKYYLLACAGSFRARKNQLWQIVFSQNGVRGGYPAIR